MSDKVKKKAKGKAIRVNAFVLVRRNGFVTITDRYPVFSFSERTCQEFFACIPIDREVVEGEGIEMLRNPTGTRAGSSTGGKKRGKK